MIADCNHEGSKNMEKKRDLDDEVTDPEINMIEQGKVIKVVEATLGKYDNIESLFNIGSGSVGRYIHDKLSPFPTLKKEEWNTKIAANLTKYRSYIKVVISHVIGRKYGKIASFSSMAGVDGTLAKVG